MVWADCNMVINNNENVVIDDYLEKYFPTEKQCYIFILILFWVFVAITVIMVILRKTIIPI